MVHKRPPAFQFYSARWLRETAGFTALARGVEIHLQALAWEAGKIPADLPTLARIAGVSLAEMKTVWRTLKPRWRTVRHSFVSKPLQAERRKQQYFRALQREKGRKGADVRWHGRGHQSAIAKPWPDDSSPKDLDPKIKIQTEDHRPNGRPVHDDRFHLLAKATEPVLLRLAHEAFTDLAAGRLQAVTDSELRARCGEARIDYTALPPDAIRQAIEKAERQRARKGNHRDH